jgi:tetratricopeptide (TPR) repeat protein
MMRHHSSLALGLATLFVLPASLPGAQEPMDLEARLEATVAALEHLGGIERRIQAGDHSILGELLLATEAPLPDAQQRDEALTLFRGEVAELQQRWDELTSGGSPFTSATRPMPAPTDGGARPNPLIHVGLQPSMYAEIRAQILPQGTRPASSILGLRDYEEQDGYSADSLRQGRLLVRAERWSEALEALEPSQDDAEARYWIARCYEGLGRTGEAIELLQGLIDAGKPNVETEAEAPAPAKALARRAAYDMKFLELRRELADRRRTKEAGK